MNTSPGDAPIPLEEVARLPVPGISVPGGVPPTSRQQSTVAFTADDRQITFLFSPEGSLTQQLFYYDLETGEQRLLVSPPGGGATEANLSPEEVLRRERLRLVAQGIPQYFAARRGGRLLIPLHGGVYVLDGPGQPLRTIYDGSQGPAEDAQLSPDGARAAWVCDGEIYAANCTPGEEMRAWQVTHGARGTGRTNGLADYLAQEEMLRSHGFWWSPDGEQIAYEEVDDTHIPVYTIVHQGSEQAGPVPRTDLHYPFAGAENPRVRLGVVSAAGGEPAWMDVGPEERYLCRVGWFPDGNLAVQLENRAQTRLELLRFDPRSGQGQTLLVEESAVWINLNNLFTPLADGGFLWGSERDGFQHLYRYDRDGRLLGQLTHGESVVDVLAGVDEERGLVYFCGNRESPLEMQLYRVPLAGGRIERVTAGSGTHVVVLDHACRHFIDTWHSTVQAPLVRWCALDNGEVLRVIHDRPDPRLARLSLQTPELVQLKNRHGTTLHGAIFPPPERFGAGPFPTLVYTYGGPGVQHVKESWYLRATLRAQAFAAQGYLVFCLDNRGSDRRGLEFESAILRRMGQVEVEDQVDGVRWLVEQGLTDPQRVGIYGWSYGGYMAAMCLARAPQVFRAAVAGAPVTVWEGYDSHYTERYMGTPQENPEGYHEGSLLSHVDHLRGPLLIVHGLVDENVHFRHTARLVNALNKAHQPYELLLFPGERHLPRATADRVYMEQRIAEFFQRTLG